MNVEEYLLNPVSCSVSPSFNVLVLPFFGPCILLSFCRHWAMILQVLSVIFSCFACILFQGILDTVVSSQGSSNGTVISVQKQEFVEDACFIKVTGKLQISEMPTFIALHSCRNASTSRDIEY